MTRVFKEAGFGLTADDLRVSASAVPRPWEAQSLAYLENGHCIMASPGLCEDKLDPNRMIGGPHVFTDGVWVWPNDLAYYLRNYHIELPAEFLRHMASLDWQAPELGEDEGMAICAEYFGWEPGAEPASAPVAEH